MGTWPPFQGAARKMEGYAYESQLPSAPPLEQGESFYRALALEGSMKTMAKSHAQAELVHPLPHQLHRAR